jgi:hypothetical protein
MLQLQTWTQQQGQTIPFPQWQPQCPPIRPMGSTSTEAWLTCSTLVHSVLICGLDQLYLNLDYSSS